MLVRKPEGKRQLGRYGFGRVWGRRMWSGLVWLGIGTSAKLISTVIIFPVFSWEMYRLSISFSRRILFHGLVHSQVQVRGP